MTSQQFYPIHLQDCDFLHDYNLGTHGDSYSHYYTSAIGWIDLENQEVRTLAGHIKVADPEFFEKLAWALRRSADFCCAMHEKYRISSDKAKVGYHNITAQDAIDFLGHPEYL